MVTLMAKRQPQGDTIRSKTVTQKDLENLCGSLAVLHDRLVARADQMKKAGLTSVRFDGGGVGEDARAKLAKWVGNLGAAIEAEGA